MIHATNTGYFPTQHSQNDPSTGRSVLCEVRTKSWYMIFMINSDYFRTQHSPTDLSNASTVFSVRYELNHYTISLQQTAIISVCGIHQLIFSVLCESRSEFIYNVD